MSKALNTAHVHLLVTLLALFGTLLLCPVKSYGPTQVPFLHLSSFPHFWGTSYIGHYIYKFIELEFKNPHDAHVIQGRFLNLFFCVNSSPSTFFVPGSMISTGNREMNKVVEAFASIHILVRD